MLVPFRLRLRFGGSHVLSVCLRKAGVLGDVLAGFEVAAVAEEELPDVAAAREVVHDIFECSRVFEA